MSGIAGRLILLVSQPRAGSTLLQRMLGRHPDVHTCSERWIALHPCFALREGLWTPYGHDLARRATMDLLRELPEGEAAYWEAVRRLLGHLYERELAVSGRRRLLDKTPRYYFILPELRRLFPEARVLLLIRHPLAVLASVLDTWVGTSDAADIVGFWHDLFSAPVLMRKAMAERDDHTSIVRYEELVSQPGDVIGSVSRWLDLGQGPDLVEYGADGSAPWRFGDSGTAFQQTRPMADRAHRWPEVLRRHPLWHALGAVYLDRLGDDVLRALGYDVGETRDLLGAEAVEESARRAAAALLTEPPSPDVMRRAAAAAHERASRLDQAAAERLAIIEEQRSAIAAFEAAVAGRDAEIARLQHALDEATAMPAGDRDKTAVPPVWRSVARPKP
ncbi:MAG: sulfotransferase [Acidobacteria bacterium]|nr:sulfotransferase [Acidobacteriota bacterium]